MKCADAGNLPSSPSPALPKRQVVGNARNEVVANIESRASAAPLTIEGVLGGCRFIDGFYGETGGSIIYGMGKRVRSVPGKAIGVLVRDCQLE